MNHQITLPKMAGRQFCVSMFLVGWFSVLPSFGQHCPHGRIDLAKLAAGMEGTKDPNVILRSAAIAGPAVISVLRGMVEYADDRAYGKHPRSIVDWDNSWKHGKATPIPLSLSIDVQNPYLECLCRKIECGFPMPMIDLAATGDPRVVPILLKLKTIGYPNEGYAGSRAPYAWWVRHDYVETSLAKWGDAEEFAILEHALQIDQTSILKLQVIGGRKAMAALLESNTNPNYGMYNQALFKSLSEMVQDPPLPANADPTVENLHKWRDWWAKNKDTPRFVYPAAYE